jgi:hypothetical protein
MAKKQNIEVIKNKPTITFVWDDDEKMPQILQDNVNTMKIHDVFALSAENLIARDQRYYLALQQQLKLIYDFIYSNKHTIN